MIDSTVATRRCSKCKEEKPATTEFFYAKKGGKDGLDRRCKECQLIIAAARYVNLTPEKKERMLEQKNNRWFSLTPEQREKRREQTRFWYVQSRSDRLKKHRISDAKYSVKKSKDPIYRKRKCISASLRYQFKRINSKKTCPTFEFLEFTKEEYVNHMGRYIGKPCEVCGCEYDDTFQIDHIIPVSTAQTEDHIKQLNQLDNLRIICQTCNIKKGDKILEQELGHLIAKETIKDEH